MKLIIFSIYDVAAEAHLRPMFLPTVGQAIRVFADEVNKKDSVINQHADQYTLFEIGEFDDNKGVITGCNPISHGVGSQYLVHDGKIDIDVVLKQLKDIKKEISYLRAEQDNS